MTHTTHGLPPTYAPDQETSLIEIVNAVVRNWRAVIVLPLVLAIVVGVMTLRKERRFAATASFVPQTGESRGLGGAAALAQQFGVDLGGSKPGQSPQFYEDLLRSRTILRRAVETEFQLPGDAGQTRRGTLITYWGLTDDEPIPVWRRTADSLRKRITTNVRRETGVIELTISSRDPALAEQIVSRLLELLNDYNLEVRQTRARDETRFVSGRLREAQIELGVAEDSLGSFLRRNRDFRNSPELSFLHDRLERQVLARQEVYASLLQGQEQARLDGMRDTPVLQIIDAAAGSAQPEPRKLALRSVIAFLMGLLVAIAIAITREAARRGKLSNDIHYLEFEALVKRAWSDLRHPRRWLSRTKSQVEQSRD